MYEKRTSIGRDTTLCMSLAALPGTYGSRFHNHLYSSLELDYIYKAFTTTNLSSAIQGVQALGIRGCSISMPFKETCIPFLDRLAPCASSIFSVNTIVNNDGYLTGYNTDYSAIQTLIERYNIKPETPFLLKGSGGMAKAVAAAFCDAGFNAGTIVARNEVKGRLLAQAYNYQWQPDILTLDSHPLLINVTPIGMQGRLESNLLSFSEKTINNATIVFDVVALPAETPLIRQARSLGKTVITGDEVAMLQALKQFILYTGVTPSSEQVYAANNFAREASSTLVTK